MGGYRAWCRASGRAAGGVQGGGPGSYREVRVNGLRAGRCGLCAHKTSLRPRHNPFKAVFLGSFRIFLPVHLADKHGQGAHVKAEISVESLVHHHGLPCLRMGCNSDNLIKLVLKMPVKFSRPGCSVHLCPSSLPKRYTQMGQKQGDFPEIPLSAVYSSLLISCSVCRCPALRRRAALRRPAFLQPGLLGPGFLNLLFLPGCFLRRQQTAVVV